MAKVHELFVNGERFEVAVSELTGGQIRALAVVDPSFDLFLEGEGNSSDRMISDNERISIEGTSKRIYARPPTAFGSR